MPATQPPRLACASVLFPVASRLVTLVMSRQTPESRYCMKLRVGRRQEKEPMCGANGPQTNRLLELKKGRASARRPSPSGYIVYDSGGSATPIWRKPAE